MSKSGKQIELLVRAVEKLVKVHTDQNRNIEEINLKIQNLYQELGKLKNDTNSEIKEIGSDINNLKNKVEIVRFNSESENELYDYMDYLKDQLSVDFPLSNRELGKLKDDYQKRKKNIRF